MENLDQSETGDGTIINPPASGSRRTRSIGRLPELRMPVVLPRSEPQYILAGNNEVHTPIDFAAIYSSVFERRGKLILGLTLVGIVLGLVMALTRTPYYRTHASVELDGVNDMYLNIRDLNPAVNDSLTDGYMQTQARLLGSESMVRRALAKMPSPTDSKLPPRPGLSLGSLLVRTGLKQFVPAAPDDGRVNRAVANLTVRAVPQTRIIDVLYDDTDPYVAATFTNALLNEYVAANLERRWEANQHTEGWLTDYVSHLKQHLEGSGNILEAYTRDSGLIGTKEEDTPAETKLRDLQTELSKTHVDRVSKQALYETVTKGPQDAIPANINPSPLREYQAKLSDLRSERAQAAATLTPAHYRVQHLDAQIREMEQLISKEWRKTLVLIKSDYDSAVLREKLLGESVKTQTALVADQASKRVHYDVLKSDLQTNEEVYSSMLQKAKESAVLSAIKPSNIHVVDKARPPALPFQPNLSLYATIGSLSGFFVGIVWAAYSARRDKDRIVPGTLPALAQVRELGVIPSTRLYDPNEHSLIPGRSRAGLGDTFMFSESFNAAVASILSAEVNGAQPRVITITSALPAEGKTTIVQNLGLALANIKLRVVLIDGDLRHPKLSRTFDIDNSWGLTDLLQSNTSIEDMPFEALVKRTDNPYLFIVPSGPSVQSVASLLHSSRLPDLLETLKRHADVILIDSPPLLAVSDARILGIASDGVIFTIRANKTGRETFNIAAQQLMDDNTHLLGTILNDWNARRSPGTRDPFQYQDAYLD